MMVRVGVRLWDLSVEVGFGREVVPFRALMRVVFPTPGIPTTHTFVGVLVVRAFCMAETDSEGVMVWLNLEGPVKRGKTG